MWPGEMAPARARSNQEALRRFNSASLSYEGLARAWNIQRTLAPALGRFPSEGLPPPWPKPPQFPSGGPAKDSQEGRMRTTRLRTLASSKSGWKIILSTSAL